MCGIVYSINLNDKPVAPTILKRYKAQRSRGTEGFGYYLPGVNRLTHNTKEGRTLSLLRREAASEILFHHRFPTSTENVRNACHPFSTKDHFENNYVVVHNGMVSNTSQLKKEHEELGIKYISEQQDGRFNDSEALAYDLARYFEGQTEYVKASGSIAFIAIKRDSAGKPMALMFARNNRNPLVMKKTKNSITISSQGDGVSVPVNKLHVYHYDTGELTVSTMYIPGGWTESTSYGTPVNRGADYYNRHSSDTTPRYISRETKELDDEELSNYLYDQSQVGEKKREIQREALWDDEKALAIAKEELDVKSDRFREVELMSRDEEEYDKLSQSEMDTVIEEYIELEMEIPVLEKVVKQLEQEVRVTPPMGFRATPKETPTTPLLGTNYTIPGTSTSDASKGTD